MVIGLLPISFVASIVFFAPIGGLGLLIGYKLKRIRSTLLWGLGVAAWGYLWYAIHTDLELQFHTATNYYTKTTMTLFFYSLITVVPIAVLETLIIAWLARKKLSPDSKTLSAFFKLVPFTLLIATPFIIGGLSDYNYRGDTNPQVMNLRIADKWIDRDIEWATEELYDVFILKGETLDGSSWFSFPVSADFYNEHDIGSYCWISVHNGALGYPYISQEHGL